MTYNDTVTEIRVEIQIRSFAMDYWAELDTQMCYKKDAGQIANVERETRGYSDVIAKVDNKMLELLNKLTETCDRIFTQVLHKCSSAFYIPPVK